MLSGETKSIDGISAACPLDLAVRKTAPALQRIGFMADAKYGKLMELRPLAGRAQQC
jgi:hypothetical protein